MNGIWIRTQKRTGLFLVKAFGIMKMSDAYEIFNTDDDRTLGVYEDEKRALSVLDDIQKTVAQSKDRNYEYIHSESSKIEYTYPTVVVFQMP